MINLILIATGIIIILVLVTGLCVANELNKV